ncbi:hypothetical protein [Actinoplanes sp. URMC 104]|uniref:hypothetical protein n=1 Tax=Actinoplanes sp. URMC 104 TaxID=3423409 RepID=UPI003F1E3DB0
MTATTNLGPDTEPMGRGWRVHRADGTSRIVLPRLSGEGWAVYAAGSTHERRLPDHLGLAGSWRRQPEQCIAWAREAT